MSDQFLYFEMPDGGSYCASVAMLTQGRDVYGDPVQWIRDNLEWDDVWPRAVMIEHKPADMNVAWMDAVHNGGISISKERPTFIMPQTPEGIGKAPVGFIIDALSTMKQCCMVMPIGDEETLRSAIIFAQGPQEVVRQYIRAVEIATEMMQRNELKLASQSGLPN